jgi:hypothetical protein
VTQETGLLSLFLSRLGNKGAVENARDAIVDHVLAERRIGHFEARLVPRQRPFASLPRR